MMDEFVSLVTQSTIEICIHASVNNHKRINQNNFIELSSYLFFAAYCVSLDAVITYYRSCQKKLMERKCEHQTLYGCAVKHNQINCFRTIINGDF
jgi:hypothetical protein